MVSWALSVKLTKLGAAASATEAVEESHVGPGGRPQP